MLYGKGGFMAMNDRAAELDERAARINAAAPGARVIVETVEVEGMTAFTCARCGGRFTRKATAPRAPECPICGCKRWDAQGVKFRRSKGLAKPSKTA